jgi:DNA-binding transcriptional regulator YiaG
MREGISSPLRFGHITRTRIYPRKGHSMQMTSHEFVRSQAVLKMKNRDMQSIFGVSDQTIVNWRKGYTKVPGAVAWAIRSLLKQVKTEL